MQKPKGNDQGSGRGMITSVQFFGSLNKFIPSLVLQNWIDRQVEKEKLQDQLKHYEQRLKKDKESQETKFKINTLKQQFAKQQASAEVLPQVQDMETVCLFADISGFTKISEACAAMGIRGNEELAFCINRYMESMVKNLYKFGGDVIKFVGDAMIVMWPKVSSKKALGNSLENAKEDDDEKVNTIRKAIQCAYDIQKELNNKKITNKVTSLSVKIGIGFGKCALLYVGGLFNRSEYLTVGPALLSALGSEGCATGGGQIVISDTAFKYVKDKYVEGKELINEEGKKFYLFTKIREGVRGRADAVLLKSSIKLDRIASIQKSLKSCVPAAIMPYLEIGFEYFGSETRALTVMFASLGIDLSAAGSREGMNLIQKVVTTVQQMVYRLEGSVNKLVLDDKGSTLICIWGLCPMAHTDDPQRAILTALNMKKALAKVENTWCNVGIATGDVFSGVVGTSGNRKEFSVLGDVVNLAARIMFWPLKFNKTGKINCCLRTKNEAMNQMCFNYGGHCEFKGKSISIPIFEPIDPCEEFAKPKPPQQYLKLWYNPIVIQRSVQNKKYHDKFIDRYKFVGDLHDAIKSYFFRSSTRDEDRMPLSMVIQGQIGSGKTHAVRSLCERLQKDQEFIQDLHFGGAQKNALKGGATLRSQMTGAAGAQGQEQQLPQKALPIFASSINAELRLKFLGSWIPILRNMFDYKRKYDNLDKAQLFSTILQGHYDVLDLMAELFGLYPTESPDTNKEYQQFVKQTLKGQSPEEQVRMVSKDSPISFLLQEAYEPHVTAKVVDLIVDFIKDYAGIQKYDNLSISRSDGTSDLSGLEDDDNDNGFNVFGAKSKRGGRGSWSSRRRQKCIFMLDNASQMNSTSYSLLLRLYNECTSICIITIVQQDHKGNAIMPLLVKETPGKDTGTIGHEEEQLDSNFKKNSRYFEMNQLSTKDLKKILLELAPKYYSSYTEEMCSMTEIINPAKTIKTVEDSNKWKETLRKKWNLAGVYQGMDDEVVDLIAKKCEGNPLICLQFFFNLIQNEFLKITRDFMLVPTQKYEECCMLADFTSVPVPSSAHKRRLKNIDDLLQKGMKQKEKNVKKHEQSIKGVMLMKSAAIIGEEFGTYALKKILPLRNETHGSMLQILKDLEKQEFIEILDESDQKDIICRFNKIFLRESLYQIMLFRDQKQTLHRNLAEHYQSLPISLMDQKQIDIQMIKLKNHLCKGEDANDECDLPLKLKQGLIIKRVQFMILQNNTKRVIHKGFIQKQGQKGKKTISDRLLILTAKEIQWFHNVEEYENNAQPLGIIKIEHIFRTSETLMKEHTYDFELGVSQYLKKGVLQDQPRNISFGCLSEDERHKWISIIEFLKTKSVYDTYVNKFVNIQFPLRKVEDLEDDQEAKEDILAEKLSQFGKNFILNARINQQALNNKVHLPRMNTGHSYLKQQTTMTSKAPGAGANTNNQQRQSAYRNSVFSYNNRMIDDAQSDDGSGQNIVDAQSLSKKIAELYRASVIGFVHQTSSNANKSQNMNSKNKNLGQMPEFYEAESFFPTNDDKFGKSEFSFDQSRRASRASEIKPNQLNSLNKTTRRSTSRDSEHKNSLKETPEGVEKIDEQDEKSSSEQERQDPGGRGHSQEINTPEQPKQQNRKVGLGLHKNLTDPQMQIEGLKNTSNSKPGRQSQRINTQSGVDPTDKNSQVLSSQEKTSGNSAKQVSTQLKMLDQDNKIQRISTFKNFDNFDADHQKSIAQKLVRKETNRFTFMSNDIQPLQIRASTRLDSGQIGRKQLKSGDNTPNEKGSGKVIPNEPSMSNQKPKRTKMKNGQSQEYSGNSSFPALQKQDKFGSDKLSRGQDGEIQGRLNGGGGNEGNLRIRQNQASKSIDLTQNNSAQNPKLQSRPANRPTHTRAAPVPQIVGYNNVFPQTNFDTSQLVYHQTAQPQYMNQGDRMPAREMAGPPMHQPMYHQPPMPVIYQHPSQRQFYDQPHQQYAYNHHRNMQRSPHTQNSQYSSNNYPRSQAHGMGTDIKDEINNQINRGLQKFFREFDAKMESRSQRSYYRSRSNTPEREILNKSVNAMPTYDYSMNNTARVGNPLNYQMQERLQKTEQQVFARKMNKQRDPNGEPQSAQYIRRDTFQNDPNGVNDSRVDSRLMRNAFNTSLNKDYDQPNPHIKMGGVGKRGHKILEQSMVSKGKGSTDEDEEPSNPLDD